MLTKNEQTLEPPKSLLINKSVHYDKAEEIFDETKINILTSGRKPLGGTIGSKLFSNEYVECRENK